MQLNRNKPITCALSGTETGQPCPICDTRWPKGCEAIEQDDWLWLWRPKQGRYIPIVYTNPNPPTNKRKDQSHETSDKTA